MLIQINPFSGLDARKRRISKLSSVICHVLTFPVMKRTFACHETIRFMP